MAILSKNPSLVDTFLGRRKQVVVLVDPYSTGCLVGQEIAKRGYLLICLWTDQFADVMKAHVPISCGTMQYYAVVEQTSGMGVEAIAEEIQEACLPYELVSVMAGGDRGVDFADALSEHLGLMTNGTYIPNRRDKKIQQELVAASGLRAVRQAGGDKFHMVEDFLKREPYPVVLKPIESSGSDGVKLCYTFQEAKEHFNSIMNTPMIDGGANTGVLAQEFLRGKEYVVDHVSRNGIHKTMMVWVYDKRSANGASFVYFGCVPIDSKSHEAKILIPYVRGVLDAMGVKHGASHAEVMMTPDGPCLVEMNCRTNGGDGIWRPLARALTGGYTQVEACADAYLDEEAFNRYPDKPPSPFRAAGQEIELVSYSRGIVRATPGYEMIAQLPSFVHLESNIKPGSTVEYTIDLDTCVGTVCLMHPEESVVQKDVEFIRYMEIINGLFQYEPVLENLKRPRGEAVVQKSVSIKPPHRRVFSSDGSSGLIRKVSQSRDLRRATPQSFQFVNNPEEVVVLVDPYSTGSCVAQEFMQRGYSVLALWTNGFPEEMKNYIPTTVTSQGKLDYLAQIKEGKSIEETVAALQKAAGGLKIVAMLAGDDAGVDLVDSVTEKLGLRSNGTLISKRDKKLQQEVLERVGLSSMRQAGGSDFSEISFFLKQEAYPIVLKPAKSAPGSDGGVKLCWKFEDAKQHFNYLLTSQTVTNALEAPSVLAQEFLRGKEYVVDHVSRDGVHKTMMIWYLDKRPANGANHVYFGAVPVDVKSPEASILIPYVRMVLSAMGVEHGPSHAEVMLATDGPCLIKLNCSPHKGDGNWIPLCRALTGGYSQVDVAVEAYLGDDNSQFSKIPSLPPSPFKASGLEVLLVSFSRGIVKATPGFDVIQQLPSFISMETGITVGSAVEYTTDLYTNVGSVMLMHFDKETLKRDVARIREMESNNTLFEYEPMTEVLKSDATVSVLDVTPLVISAGRPGLL